MPLPGVGPKINVRRDDDRDGAARFRESCEERTGRPFRPLRSVHELGRDFVQCGDPPDDAAEAKANLAWSRVTDESVAGLELRGSVGPEYNAEDESIIATFASGDPRT